jgi:pyridoxal phosphate enzyme (YggS family)
MNNSNILEVVNASIQQWEQLYGREAQSVELIAVSKTRGDDEIRVLYNAGQRRFGENYLQEALDKIGALSDCSIEWHFIGAIQSRKAAQIAEMFDWVHSLDRLKVANKLNQHAASDAPLNVLIQVNLEGEASKGGVAPEQLVELAAGVDKLDNLRLRGLMFMPKVHTELSVQREVFQQARVLFENLKKSFPDIDQISMGMSGDMQAAIAEGATMVRVGTALFGPRQKTSENKRVMS